MVEQLKNKKILFATVPADGHFNPLTGLARFLLESGCDVRWYTSKIYQQKLKNLGIPHYPFEEALDVNAENFDELFPERKHIHDAGARADFDMKEAFTGMAPGQVRDINRIRIGFPFELIITDSLFPAIPIITAKLQVPHIAIGVIPIASESVDLGPFGLGLVPPQNEQEKEQFAMMRKTFNEVVFKNSIEAFSQVLTEHGVPHRKSLLFDMLIRHSGICLQIGSPSFEFERSDLGDNIRFIGSLLPYKRKEAHPWNDDRITKYEHVILVTQGTVERDTTKILEPALSAFANTNVLVVATTGGNGTEALRKKYNQANIIIEDYIPFDEIMPMVDVYVTNGGFSGTLLGIKHKLPMVVAGIHEGKAEICSRIGYHNYGINLQTENPSPEAVKEAVNRILTDDSYQKNVAALSEEMDKYKPLELCVEYISKALA